MRVAEGQADKRQDESGKPGRLHDTFPGSFGDALSISEFRTLEHSPARGEEFHQ